MENQSSGWTMTRVLEVLRRSWIVIAVITVLGATGAFAVSASTTPVFRSTATLYFVLSQGSSGTDLNQGSTYTQNQMLSFAQLATSSRVVQPVIDDLDLGLSVRDLARNVEIFVPQDTVILQIQVSDADPQRAADIANALASSLTETVDSIAPRSGASATPTVSAETIDAAVVPRFQSLPDKPRDTALGLVAGLLVGIAGALVVALLDTRVRNSAMVEATSGASLLTSIPRSPREGIDRLPVLREPLGTVAENLRRLRAALDFANVAARSRRLIITSAQPREGKSTITSNLALVLAQTGARVLLIDADLRRPQQGERFGVESSVGLTTVLTGEVDLATAVLHRHRMTMDLLPSGSIPPNPAELLASSAMLQLLQDASEAYDYVIIDTPPVLSVSDATVLAPVVDAVVLIIDAYRTRENAVRSARRLLDSTGARLLGVVLNRAGRERRRHRYDARAPYTGRARPGTAPAADEEPAVGATTR